jgi:hypothetical protein
MSFFTRLRAPNGSLFTLAVICRKVCCLLGFRRDAARFRWSRILAIIPRRGLSRGLKWLELVQDRSSNLSWHVPQLRSTSTRRLDGKPNSYSRWHLYAVPRTLAADPQSTASHAPLAVGSPTAPTGGAFTRRWALGLARLGRRRRGPP